MTEDVTRIGLLFVHGIGEQKPFEHLRTSVAELAELMARGSAESVISCAVEDRASAHVLPPGTPTAAGEAPITLRVRVAARAPGGGAARPTRHYVFACHEVYWGDLGARSGLADTLTFWLWGLGQWCAPIYRDLDAARMRKAKTDRTGDHTTRPVSDLARLPKSVAGEFWIEFGVRLKLWLSGVAALFTLLTWSLLKRVAAKLLQSAPSPSLLVQYVGDVRTYEERARPGDSTLSDPGFPRRVAIRRRMVSQMVAMGARTDLKEWYVFAHSLGSVVAYNGLTEIGHALPNYLSAAQWAGLPLALKRDSECLRRDGEEHLMMPARPDWLVPEDVIDRRALFAGLRGFVTYGSPLNKFAALWPRIVATAKDRKVPDVFTRCRWINLQAPLDPVAGTLDRFGARQMGTGQAPEIPPFAGYVPACESHRTPILQWFLLAHLRYFRNAEPYAKGVGIRQRMQLAQWLVGENPEARIESIDKPVWLGRLVAIGTALLLTLVLGVVTAGVVAFAGGLGRRVLSAGGEVQPPSWSSFIRAFCDSWPPLLAIVFGVILAAGLIRWATGSWFDARMAVEQKAANRSKKRRPQVGTPPCMKIDGSWEPVVRLQRRQCRASIVMLVLAGAAMAAWAGFAFRIGGVAWPGFRAGDGAASPFHTLLLIELALLLLAIAAQAAVNCTLPPVRPKGGGGGAGDPGSKT
ncbi:hypothetical protein [Sphingomonas elodea]|uniref:hypothetical protein n=1 Tax=Sphingomonas elodea TaxID=179878 RepID=UPI0002631A3B|nr:hypothetical protein [Sphingomonas elodea]